MPKNSAGIDKVLGKASRMDMVEIALEKEVLHGNFINFDDSENLLIIKLKSGYDVAIPKKEIKSMKIIEKAKVSVEHPSEEVPKKGDIKILATGGTIASKIDYGTGGVSPTTSPDYYLKIAPEMKSYGTVSVDNLMSIFSENMMPSHWIAIAKAAYEAVKEGSKGIIVTMGTDTMHYASAALSFMLNPLSVPIVFTGAQRSTDRGSSDAAHNLTSAAIVASRWDGGESVICMHGSINDDYNLILRGNKVRKMHTERRDTFRPINIRPLGRVYPTGKIEPIPNQDWIKRSDGTHLDTKIDEKVKILMAYPSMGGDIIKYYLQKGIHGLIVVGTGFGNLPLADKSVLSALKEAKSREVPIVITSQAFYGSTNRFVYSTLRELSAFDNIIYVEDMLTEAAFSKLMFVLGHTKDMREIKDAMEKPMAGELEKRSRFDEFLL